MMLKIDFPAPSFNIKTTNEKDYIFDIVRKKWILLTPEEWVRQNIIAYLIQTLQYPAALLAIEKEIAVNGLKRRCDIVVYANNTPWMIIECKEPEVALNEKVLTQILHYNITLDVPYLIISNGNYSYGWFIEGGKQVTLNKFPKYGS
ncbi:MAG: type I restriction enzyme HsdR N-terminal domain-containing protein [Bacteroidota bacterium]